MDLLSKKATKQSNMGGPKTEATHERLIKCYFKKKGNVNHVELFHILAVRSCEALRTEDPSAENTADDNI